MSWPADVDAPPRTDLPWLRHRTRPRPVTQVRPAALSEFVAGHGHHPDGTAPRAPKTPPAPEPAGSTSLDLSTPGPTVNRTLSTPAAAVAARSGPAPRRVVAGQAEVLTPRAPTVTLTRVQSGVGALVVEGACSEAVGDLRLAAAYRLADGTTSLLRHADGATTVPARGGPPVLLAQRHGFERLVVDLHQVRRLDRLVVLAFSASDGPLAWGGTLVTTTLGGSRVEVPLDAPPGPGVVVVLSAYVVEGEVVLRAEPREVSPSLREACVAHGFDRITWLDAHTPLT